MVSFRPQSLTCQRDIDSGGWVIRIATPLPDKDVEAIQELYQSGKEVEVLFQEHKKKRSLDANAYAWVLCGKLAEALHLSKNEVYRNAIKNIGGNHEIVCVKDEAVQGLAKGWAAKGAGWQTETMPCKTKGCTTMVLYYGSSVYNTTQMSLLIDNLIQDCEALGIETKSPDELAKLLSLWESKDEKHNNE